MAKSTLPKAIVLTIWACWLFLIMSRMVIPPLIPLIERDLGLSHGEAALLMSVYMLPYALVQLPAGSLSDRFGRKYFIVVSVSATCLATVLMAFARSFNELLVLRIVSGLTGGMLYAPATAYVVQSTAGKDVGMALGLVFTGGSFSNIVVNTLIHFLPVEEYGWRSFFLLSAVPGVFYAPFLLFLLRGGKAGLKAAGEGLDIKVFWQGLKSSQLILLLVYGLTSAFSNWSLSTFVSTFLVLDRGFTVSDASLLMMIFYTTSIFSGPLSGFVMKSLGSRAPAFISAAAMCAISYAIPLGHSWITIILVFMLWGLLGGLSWTPNNVLISTLAPKGFQGTFLGIYNLAGFLSGTLGPIVFGRVADTAGFQAFFTLSFLLYLIPLGISIILMRSKPSIEREAKDKR